MITTRDTTATAPPQGEPSQALPTARGRLAFLSVTAPLDYLEAGSFLEQALALGRRQRCLVVDLERCDYADSAGIRALVKLADALEANGGELRLVVPRKSRICRALSLLRLLQRLQVYSSLPEACVPALAARASTDGVTVR